MDYQKLMVLRNKKNAFAGVVGIKLTEIREGYARAELAVNEHHLNPIGSVHGGCLYTLADMAGGAAATSHGYAATTLNSDIHYLNAGIHTTYLYAEAKEIKHGKKTMVYEIHITDQNQKLLAAATFTFMSLGIPIKIEDAV